MPLELLSVMVMVFLVLFIYLLILSVCMCASAIRLKCEQHGCFLHVIYQDHHACVYFYLLTESIL